MSDETTIVFGVPVPSVGPLLPGRRAFLVGITCVVAGIAAMLSQKRRGRHSTFGTTYYWCLSVLVVSATGLSLVRWTENYHLFVLGALSLIAATIARTALRQHWRNRLRVHLASMGLSYILILTAFYVDNGKNLPVWRALPQWAFWVLPVTVGAPIIIYGMLRHPLMRQAVAR
jgi:Phosphatidylinositolglycan class N (PIG-N)